MVILHIHPQGSVYLGSVGTVTDTFQGRKCILAKILTTKCSWGMKEKLAILHIIVQVSQ